MLLMVSGATGGEMANDGTAAITVERIGQIGIGVRDRDQATAFHRVLAFALRHQVTFDALAIIEDSAGLEINLIVDANAGAAFRLPDVPAECSGSR